MSKRRNGNGDPYDDADHTPVNLGLDEFRYLPTAMQTRVLRAEMNSLRSSIDGVEHSIKVGGWKMAGALLTLVLMIGGALIYSGRMLERIDTTAKAVEGLSLKVDRLVETPRRAP